MKSLCTALLALGLSACAAPGVEHYANEQPRLDLKEYLNGEVDAWGMVQGWTGVVKKRFHVTINARWDGDTGVLDEQFNWSDGTTSQRRWTLNRRADGTWRGTASDVIGEAIGEVAGNTLRWRYVLALPIDGNTYHVKFDDWMILMNDKVMMNRSYMSKWGVPLGEVTLTFVKR